MTPRVLITGATGFLGLPCVRRAIATGVEVHAAARSDRGELPPGVQLHPICLLESDGVDQVLHAVRPTHLLHLAWIATPGVYWTSPDNPRWVEATLRLMRSFSRHGGQRAVLTGTCAEYDWATSGHCHETGTPTRPATLYGSCKNELRLRAEAIAAESGLSLAWARLFFLYGPREHPARLVPSMVRSLLTGEPAECSAGNQERDFLHVDDVADALTAILFHSVAGPINVGSGEAVSVRSVVETIAKEIGRSDLPRLGARPTAANEPPLLVADVNRLRNEVGWSPRIELRKGLADTVAWWRSHHVA